MCTFTWIDSENKELKSIVFLKVLLSEIFGKTELRKTKSKASESKRESEGWI